MFKIATYALAISLGSLVTVALVRPSVSHSGQEWTMRVSVPPCKAVQNVQVIWPAKPNGAIQIECDNQ